MRSIRVWRINLGIRRRLRAHDGDRRRVELLTGLLLSMLGLRSFITATRSAWVTTFIWATERSEHADAMERRMNAGFSTADPERLYSPLISNPVYGYQAINVDSQRRSAHSLLSWTKS